jgi:hypothetical protein
MLVTFREHAAPDLCILHRRVTMEAARRSEAGVDARRSASDLFTAQYECRTNLWYSKC